MKPRENQPLPNEDETDELTAAHYSTGATACSVMSSVMPVVTVNRAEKLDDMTLT